MTGVWYPEISIVYHRRSQGSMDLPKFLAYLVGFCFERRYPKTNTVARLKSKLLTPPKILGWLRHSCVWFEYPTFPESKSKILLKLSLDMAPI